MQEVASTREQHGHSEFIAGFDRFGIPQTAARVDDSADAMGCRQTDGVIEGKEAITRQNRPLGLIGGSLQGDPCRANAIHLASSNTQALAIARNDDGVGTHVTHQTPGEFKVLSFLG